MQYRALIGEDVLRDTRKLDASENFTVGVYGPDDGSAPLPNTIKWFAELRRAALLAHPDVMRARAKAP
jgi:hypothetical protein